MAGSKIIRKSTEYSHKGEWEVVHYWDDDCTIQVRYFKTRKEAEKYLERG